MSFGLINYNGGRSFDSLDKYIDDFFGDLFFTRRPKPLIKRSVVNPPVNISESEKDHIITIAAPGLSREDFKVRIDRGVLSVSYETKEEEKNSDYRNFGYGSFTRSWNLPKGITFENVSATYRDGILSVNVNKVEGENSDGDVIEVE